MRLFVSYVLLVILNCGLLLIPRAFSSESSYFPDTERHVYKEAIQSLYEGGTISGYSDGLFRPQNLINRAELLKIVIHHIFSEEEIFSDQLLSDVSVNDWFASYVSTGLRENIVSGYSDGTFRPAQSITFVEAAKIIVLGLELPFEASEDAPWYEGYVKTLELHGAIPSSIHYLDHEITRGEVSEILYRVQENLTQKSSTSYQTLLENAEASGPAFEILEEGSTYVIALDAKRLHMNVLTGNDSIRPVECDFPHHCVAEIQAESFGGFLNRSQKAFLVNGAFFDAYTYELNGVNYHETGGDIIINGTMESMFGWDEAFGDGGMLARMQDGTYRFFYPIRDWVDVYDTIDMAISNYPLVLNEGTVIDEETYEEQTENDSKFWEDSRRAGLGLSPDGETIYYVNLVGDVAALGETMKVYGASSGFQLDAGASLGLAHENEVLFSPGRNLVTTIEFY